MTLMIDWSLELDRLLNAAFKFIMFMGTYFLCFESGFYHEF